MIQSLRRTSTVTANVQPPSYGLKLCSNPLECDPPTRIDHTGPTLSSHRIKNPGSADELSRRFVQPSSPPTERSRRDNIVLTLAHKPKIVCVRTTTIGPDVMNWTAVLKPHKSHI